jgi:hypothetical protein
MIARTQGSTILILLSILLMGVAGCAPAGTQPVDLATPTLPSIPSPTIPAIPSATVPVEAPLPSGWDTYNNNIGQCRFTISHPSNMDSTSQGTYSWYLSISTTEPSGPVPNFLYVSVIPDGFQGGPGEIYNYDPAETQTLLNMQVGESRSVRDFDPNLAPAFTYTRLPDRTLSNQAAQTYENTQPWEFPQGTKEIRYYLKANGCTYLIGGYMTTTGSGQLLAIDEELFNQIIATFRLAL